MDAPRHTPPAPPDASHADAAPVSAVPAGTPHAGATPTHATPVGRSLADASFSGGSLAGGSPSDALPGPAGGQRGGGQALASEDAYLACIHRHFPQVHPHVLVGRGDDCAILRTPPTLCVSTDLFLEDVHFRRSYFLPHEIGHKALAVNLSDIAASGARPLGFSLGLMVPAGWPADEADALLAGMAALAAEHDVCLTGGDLSRSGTLGVCITVWGTGVDAHTRGAGGYLCRGAVQPGDVLFLVGLPGLARTGFMALEALGREAALSQYPASCAAHLTPQPLLREGLTLAEVCRGLVRHGATLDQSTAQKGDVQAGSVPARTITHTPVVGQGPAGAAPPAVALMDLSDGLARDLPRLLGSGVPGGGPVHGAALEIVPAMLHPEVVAFATATGADPVLHAYRGGEDYCLLGACAAEHWRTLHEALPQAVAVGRVMPAGHGVTVNGDVVAVGGFDHFGA